MSRVGTLLDKLQRVLALTRKHDSAGESDSAQSDSPRFSIKDTEQAKKVGTVVMDDQNGCLVLNAVCSARDEIAPLGLSFVEHEYFGNVKSAC